MNIFDNYLLKITKIILKNKESLNLRNFKNLENVNIEVPPKYFNFDLSTNISLVLSKTNKINPNDLAKSIKDLLLKNISHFEKIEVAKPGFLNIKLSKEGIVTNINSILKDRDTYGSKKLNKKYNFIKKKTNLLDLGSSPGGWTQVASQIIKSGKIMSIDIKEMDTVKHVRFLKGDIFDKNVKNEVKNYFESSLDVIVSDMAADTTGNKSLDSIRTNQLCYEIMNFSSQILKTNGILVSKLFMGEDFIEVKKLVFNEL